jgi:DNA-binding NarL/FixJ family response regulator
MPVKTDPGGRRRRNGEAHGDALLTTRELEVLKLVACGYAKKRFLLGWILEETTKTHVKNILAKLGARDRTHAVSLGMKRGLSCFSQSG